MCARSQLDAQTDDLLAALSERKIYSRGDLDDFLAGHADGAIAGYLAGSTDFHHLTNFGRTLHPTGCRCQGVPSDV